MDTAMSYDPDDGLRAVFNDAMHRECIPLEEADDEDPLRFLAHDGIDHTTGLDSLFQDHHAGVMMCAGFAMMESDDDC